jgi:MOSC domain-containing protein
LVNTLAVAVRARGGSPGRIGIADYRCPAGASLGVNAVGDSYHCLIPALDVSEARVTALSTTPVKGLRLRSHERIELERSGASGDRRFYLIDARRRMVNGKQLGSLSSVESSYDAHDERLCLSFPDGTGISERVLLGETVQTRFYSRPRPARAVIGPWAQALTAHCGQELELVAAEPGASAVDRGAEGAVTLMSRASLERLEQLAASAVDARRFRMLVEVDGVGAHAEDAWVGSRVRIGEALVEMGGHVGRCLVTSRDPDSGAIDLPTLELLRSYRAGLETSEPLAFGIYGAVLEPGAVALGDAVAIVA